MRMSTLFALSFVALLAGCNSSTAPAPQAPAAKPISDHVGGRVMLREPRELSAQSKLELKIADVAQPDMVLAQTTVSPANAPPIMFNLVIDTSKVDPKRTYAVEAILTDGDRRYLPVLQYPVLTHNAPSTVEVMMAPEPTPSEKMYEEFKKTLGQIGGMKSINGSALNDNASVAWDAFVQGTNAGPKVRVVREITDLDGDKGRITYKMAYQNDKPWVAVKEEAPAGSNHPFATTRVGWDDNGQLVLKEHAAGGQNSEVSADDAKAIYEHARQALATAQTKVPKK
ncbi:MAG TPA: YbaY family lipoprotein [Rudaea sp.]|jgi:putative lipoprotein|nr:YbaY family lipoprotein [Rudaea sp.]